MGRRGGGREKRLNGLWRGDGRGGRGVGFVVSGEMRWVERLELQAVC